MSEILKEPYNPEIEVNPTEKTYSFETNVQFIDLHRNPETIVSVNPPVITQAGILQFLLLDCLINIPLSVIHRWKTKQIEDLKQSHISIK